MLVLHIGYPKTVTTSIQKNILNSAALPVCKFLEKSRNFRSSTGTVPILDKPVFYVKN